MIICDDLRLCFLHTPKTGGSSFTAALAPYSRNKAPVPADDVSGWQMSEKLDGMRCVWDGAKGLWSRGGNEILVPPALLASLIAFPLIQGATHLPIFITPGLVGGMLLVSLVMCSLSALVSSRRLRRADPAELFWWANSPGRSGFPSGCSFTSAAGSSPRWGA